MPRSLYKISALVVAALLSVLTSLSGIFLFLYQDPAYQANYNAELSASAYISSRTLSDPSEKQIALNVARDRMQEALWYRPYHLDNWRRLRVMEERLSIEDDPRLMSLDDIIDYYEGVTFSTKPGMIRQEGL